MTHCWETRGCDAEMWSRCPHGVSGDYCPIDCTFAVCTRPTHKPATGLAIFDNPDVDRNAAIKEVCRYCTFFINHGPLISERTQPAARPRISNEILEQARRAYEEGLAEEGRADDGAFVKGTVTQ